MKYAGQGLQKRRRGKALQPRLAVAGAVFNRPCRNGREDLIRHDVEAVLTLRVVTRSPVGTRSTASDVLAFQSLFLKSTMPV